MQSLKKYFFEGILIVFSVLFALFIDNYAQRLKVEKQKKLAIERIKLELFQNQKIAQGWLVHHGKILERIKDLMTPMDSLKKEFSKDNYLTFALLTGGKPVTNELLSSTAWETAKSTTIIEEFDFEMIESLTRAYEHQNFLTDKTLNGIVNTYFERDSHEFKNIDSTLKQFLIRFNELTAQERLLLKIYEETSQKLK